MTLPFVRDFLLQIARSSPLERVVRAVELRRPAELRGLTPSAQLLATALLHAMTGRPTMLVVDTNQRAEQVREALASFQELTRSADEDRPYVLPAYEIDPYEGLSPHDEILEQQALSIWKATQGAPMLVVPAVAASIRWAAPQSYKGLARSIRRGDFIDLEGIAEHLVVVGYRRSDPVELPGQFSVRGGLLDVFSPEAERPVRIELFGDEVESLREFDAGSQRSVRPVEQTTLLPLTPLPLTPERISHLAPLVEDRPPLDDGGRASPAIASIIHDALPGWEFAIAAREGFHHWAFDLSRDALVIVAEPDLVAAEVERWWKRLRDRYASARASAAADSLSPPEAVFFTPEELKARLNVLPRIEMRELRFDQVDLGAEALELQAGDWLTANASEGAQTATDAETLPTETPATGAPRGHVAAVPAVFEWPSRPSTRYHGAIARMMEEVRAELDSGQRLLFIASNIGEVERLTELFTEYNLPFQLGVRPKRSDDYLLERSYFSTEVPQNIVVRGAVARGFTLPEQKLTVFGYADVFRTEEAYQGQRPERTRSQLSSFLSDFRDLAMGDFVVHVEHGIGKYLGLKSLAGDGAGEYHVKPAVRADAAGMQPEEFMVLEYAEQAKLYVPLTRMDLVQKYRSGEGVAPALDRLGGTQWQQRKSRVKKAMKDMADELLKLYAARQSVHLEACAADGHWQREFEDAFPFNETPDQEKAIIDVRKDLETARPMDRLLVGDVGYGKTEVAMRAAFKVVSENRQAAVLVPTTVLAFQHYETFKQRFSAFPVTIEMLSSFRSPAEQKEVIERLSTGKVDVIIGTHRLLSKDVRFHNLGLLVVDEEQRFGVRHKERLKQLKKEVHVLAMSATPIPRTLNMSLAGLRDMSVIETPPKDRLAIQTVVAAWDEKVIRVAIENELERGGQVYFVHNRIETIWEIASLIQRLVPRARVVVAHGQMGDARKRGKTAGAAAAAGQKQTEAELERAMLRFMRHEADVLVSTSIIENGLDIPLANTILVNRADRFGLSELYQLRGRVGRSNRRAYAYLLVPEQGELTPLARKRLAAMREFSDLGAGFKIAALDLELRGAGNLLGGEQSGHIEAVGFDLYVQMLERTVRELKGETLEPEVETQIHLGLDIRIPAEYISEENQRLRMYKRLAEAEEPKQQQDVQQELTDRYGPPPAPVQNLLAYASLKASCRRLGVQTLERRGENISVRFMEQSPVDPARVAQLVSSLQGAQFTPGGVLKAPIRARGAAAILDAIRQMLGTLEGEAVPA